jgi:hypothetical protein
MHAVSSSSSAQQPAASDSTLMDARRMLTETITSALELCKDKSSKIARESDPSDPHLHMLAIPDSRASMRGHENVERVHSKLDGNQQTHAHTQDLGVHAICFVLLQSMTEECSPVSGRVRQSMASQYGVEGAHAHGYSLAEAQQHVHAAPDAHCTPDARKFGAGNSIIDPCMAICAWNVVQCLLLDFLCCLVRLQGTQVLGAIHSSVKRYCQGLAPPSNTAGVNASTGGDIHICARGEEVAELWTCGVSWVLNVCSLCMYLKGRDGAVVPFE